MERVAQTPKVCFLGYRNHGIYASLNSICLICSRSHHSMSMSNIFMGYWAMDLKHAHIASSPPPFPHLAFAMSCHVLSTCLSSERNRKNAIAQIELCTIIHNFYFLYGGDARSDPIDKKAMQTGGTGDRSTYFASSHFLYLIAICLFFYCISPRLKPLFKVLHRFYELKKSKKEA